MSNGNFPSLTDTQFCIVSEIQNSMNENYEISQLDQKEGLTPKETVRLRRRKRNVDLINLEQSVVLSEIHYLYFKKGDFKAGVYQDALISEEFFSRKPGEGALTEPIPSGQKWKEHDESSEIKKYKQANKKSSERDVFLVLYELLDMAKRTKIPPLQKVIDHSMATQDEKERREIFNRTLNINLTRHIADWSELREISRKELLHHSFRERLEGILENLDWLKVIDQDSTSFYFYDDNAEELPDKNGPNEGFKFKQRNQYLLRNLKQFHKYIQGYDSEYFESVQDIDENSERKVNAPQIFRSDVIEEKLLPFFFKEEKLKLSRQDIFNLLSEFIERYISGVTGSVSDLRVSDDGEESSLSDEVAVNENNPEMEEGIVRENLIAKIKNLDKEMLKKLNVIYTFYLIKERIEFYKNELKRERATELNKYAVIIKTDDNSTNFSPIRMDMRVNRIDELIQEEVVEDYYNLEDKIEDLILEIDVYLKPITSSYPKKNQDSIQNEIMDILVESIMKNLDFELSEVTL